MDTYTRGIIIVTNTAAGYIDIILKRRQRKERFGADGNEEEVLAEAFISPGRAIEIHGLPAGLKKAKADNLAKPGLLRNSGGTWLSKIMQTDF